jgi:hypothetical protein
MHGASSDCELALDAVAVSPFSPMTTSDERRSSPSRHDRSNQ